MNLLVTIWMLLVNTGCHIAMGSLKYAVSLTTIPPRFSSLHFTLLSWLGQEETPCLVVIFVPLKYKRFKRRLTQSYNIISYKDSLTNILLHDKVISWAVTSGIIQVIEIEKDFGPATKFLGMLHYQQLLQNDNTLLAPDYWIVGDDDVRYSPITIAKYHFALQMEFKGYSSFGLTHFSEDYRLQFWKTTDGIVSHERVLHIQGVDTYLLSQETLQDHYLDRKGLHYELFSREVNSFHQRCPESFYQDDYIVSYLLHQAGVQMYSVWNNDNMASHINDVSKSNSQMHMHPNVFTREEITKLCILKSTMNG